MQYVIGIPVAIVVLLILVLETFGELTRVSPHETAFAYNVSSGVPVTRENNPTLGFGFQYSFGYDAEFFTINTEVHQLVFENRTPDPENDDPGKMEALRWDSREGVTMETGMVIYGRVTDPYLFYAHFGQEDYSYEDSGGVDDPRILQALRQTEGRVRVTMSELGATDGAENIRSTPSAYATKLTDDASTYMAPFGFQVTEVSLPFAMEFPTVAEAGGEQKGNVIEEGRQLIRAANNAVQEAGNQEKEAEATRDSQIAQAAIDASVLLEEANRRAARITTETDVLATELEALIADVGVEGALALKRTRVFADLIEAGAMPSAFVTDKSLLAEPFYGSGLK